MSRGEGEIKKTTAVVKRSWRRSMWTIALVTALIPVLLAMAVKTEVSTALTLALKTAVTSRAASKSFLFSNNDKSCHCSSQVFSLYSSLQVNNDML